MVGAAETHCRGWEVAEPLGALPTMRSPGGVGGQQPAAQHLGMECHSCSFTGDIFIIAVGSPRRETSRDRKKEILSSLLV